MKRTELAGFLQELSEKILNDPPTEDPKKERSLSAQSYMEIQEYFKRSDNHAIDALDQLHDLKNRIKDIQSQVDHNISTSRIIHDGSHEFFKYQREFNSALHASILSLIKRVKDLEEILWYNVKPQTPLPGKKEPNPLFNEDELEEMEHELPLSEVDQRLKDHADEYLKHQKIIKAAREASEAIDQEKADNPNHPASHDNVNVNPSDFAVPVGNHPKKIHVELDCVICKRSTIHIEVGNNLHCKECGNIGMSVDKFLRSIDEQEIQDQEINEEQQ